MITRVYALWNRDRRVLVVTLLGFFIHITVYIVIACTAYATGSILPVNPPFTGCFIIPGNDTLWVIFIPNIAFETMIVVLTVYKSWSIAVQSGIRTPVFTMLMSDGLIYYWIIMAAHILSFVCMKVPSSMTLPIIGSYPSITVTVVACGRLFARLQRLLLSKSKGQSGFTTYGFGTSIVPEFLYDDNAKDPSFIITGDIGLGTMNNQHRLNSELDDNILSNTTVLLDPHKDSQPSTSRQAREPLVENLNQASGLEDSFRSKIVPTAQARTTEGPLGTATELEVEVEIVRDGPGLPTYVNRRSVLNPSPSFSHETLGNIRGKDIGPIMSIARMDQHDT
ncbi:hypothetical protein M408DRAFT_241477 [Serendipita vermifera MAFF 305830]|uniref:Uncharacterized protein n=1 Tax=Serendipita vermifera MAFF 305830 TaxID=933852 RepID=A0A0C2XSR3_SERVB|nr:hypothetical protein M408DRAFT_241477 [Serendipita vermifera MAFF 305830]